MGCCGNLNLPESKYPPPPSETDVLNMEIRLLDSTVHNLQGELILAREEIKDLNDNLEAAIELLDVVNPYISLTLPISKDFGGCE